MLQSLSLGAFVIFFHPKQVLVGALHTLFALLAITLYSFQPNEKLDLTPFGNMIFTSSVAFLVGSLMQIFLKIPIGQNIMTGIGAALAATYLAYDTQMIVGGTHKKKSYSQKEFILAALNLYQDAVNLFIQIMKLLSKNDERNDRKNRRR